MTHSLPDDLGDVADLITLSEDQSVGGTAGRFDILVATAQLLAGDGDEMARLLATLSGVYSRLLVDLSSADSSPDFDALFSQAGVVAVVARLHRSNQRLVAEQIERAHELRTGSIILILVHQRAQRLPAGSPTQTPSAGEVTLSRTSS